MDDYKCSSLTGKLVFALLIYELIFTILSFYLYILALRKKYNFQVKKSAAYRDEEIEDGQIGEEEVEKKND